MKTLSLIAQKGGTGKTPLGIHFAVRARLGGLRMLLPDLDAQASAKARRQWRSRRAPALVQASGQELDAKLAASRAHGYDLGVIDIAPHSSADARASASRSDRVGIRTQPPIRALDAIGATAELMAGLGAEAEILLNRNSPPNRIGEALIAQEARQALRVYATPVVAAISRRVACRHALIDGRSVIEFNRSGNTAAEIDRLWQGLRKELQR